MRKVWCCKWARWCLLNSMKQVKSFDRRRVMWRETAHHDKSDVLGHLMWMENSHHDQEPGLRSTWLMGWIVGTTGCHACEERTDIYVHYAAPWWEGRHIKKSAVGGVLGWWVEHGYPMGPWWEERMHSWRASFTESLLEGWKCAATAVCNSHQGRMDKDVWGSRD
jgi:hypothetical protein